MVSHAIGKNCGLLLWRLFLEIVDFEIFLHLLVVGFYPYVCS